MMGTEHELFSTTEFSGPFEHFTGELSTTKTSICCVGLTSVAGRGDLGQLVCDQTARDGRGKGGIVCRKEKTAIYPSRIVTQTPLIRHNSDTPTRGAVPRARGWLAALLVKSWTRSGVATGVRAEQGSRVSSNGQRDDQGTSTCCTNGNESLRAAAAVAVLLEQTLGRRGQLTREPPP